MELKKVAIVIPFYKEGLSIYEEISLQQCKKVLKSHIKIAIKPEGLSLPVHEDFAEIISFNDDYFKNIASYNRLMLSAEFYKRFLNYEYILIYQLDAFVFKDELIYWCKKGFDYIGAPWIKQTYHRNKLVRPFYKLWHLANYWLEPQKVKTSNEYKKRNKIGNGGLSLRKVDKFYNLCLSMKTTIDFYLTKDHHQYNEDVFWGIEVNRDRANLKIPTQSIGFKFAFEIPPYYLRKFDEQNLPFGCHDWDAHLNYWRPIFKAYEYNI
ncbi:MAG: hypothetical protein EOP43_02085 [Sphingobacteriaceae bacterium]|nr:MAG: hypothetical protein EOP43_02085 [Sphingobacteriaceae bacterium]